MWKILPVEVIDEVEKLTNAMDKKKLVAENFVFARTIIAFDNNEYT